MAAFVPRNALPIRSARGTPERVQDEPLGGAAVTHLVYSEQRQRADAGRQQLRSRRVRCGDERERPGGKRSARLRSNSFQRRVARRQKRLGLHFVKPQLRKRVVSLRSQAAGAKATQRRAPHKLDCTKLQRAVRVPRLAYLLQDGVERRERISRGARRPSLRPHDRCCTPRARWHTALASPCRPSLRQASAASQQLTAPRRR